MRTTPTTALEALLNLTPLNIHIQQTATSTALRLRTLNLWRQYRIPHTSILDTLTAALPIVDAKHDLIPKQYIFDKKYKIHLTESKQNDTGRHNHTHLMIYTDGSKTDQGSGSGVFSEDLNIKIHTSLGQYCTIFQAECMGIILAAHAIAARKAKDENICILTDSMAVLQALNSYTVNSGLIYECHLILNDLGAVNNINLRWIKGHSGSRGNDAADELARKGSSSRAIGPEPIVPLPLGYLRSQVTSRSHDQHSALWDCISECRQTKEVLPEINKRISNTLLKLSKPQLRVAVAALTGHGHFNKHLFNLGITDSPLCRACMEEEETALHVIQHCPAVSDYRDRYLGPPRSPPEITSNIKGLLGFFGELGWLE
ncbi:uncharacterized protein LOC123721138 [Papilio machaon]|uniref:uncharacterized protein LOC123721138 n=1 Tax=Papilio machaon TaxID=76193 RepID=UPI001E662AF0|nr:uncharacterized protein LOC123721138 [Papilio machaon]